jgi:hypothetical protein
MFPCSITPSIDAARGSSRLILNRVQVPQSRSGTAREAPETRGRRFDISMLVALWIARPCNFALSSALWHSASCEVSSRFVMCGSMALNK